MSNDDKAPQAAPSHNNPLALTNRRLLSPAEFAQSIGRSRAYVYALIRGGRLNAVIEGGAQRITPAEAQKYIASLPPYRPTAADAGR